MLYLGGDKWVRKGLIKSALGDPPPPGQRGRGQADPNSPPRVNNGITGDARRSSAALGKMAFDMKVAYAVKQIRGFLDMAPKRRSRSSARRLIAGSAHEDAYQNISQLID